MDKLTEDFMFNRGYIYQINAIYLGGIGSEQIFMTIDFYPHAFGYQSLG